MSQNTNTPRSGSTPLLDTAVKALGGRVRPTQQQMAAAVTKAMKDEEHLVVQAGTGTGKSLAYLIPAIAHKKAADDLGQSGPIIVSTATLALQRQLVERDLPRLASALGEELSSPLSFATLKGRSNYLCLNKLHTGATEDDEAVAQRSLISADELTRTGREIRRIHEWAEETTTGDFDDLRPSVSKTAWSQVSVSARECVGAMNCDFGESCFAEQARQQAQQVDIVVTNHALLAIDALTSYPVLPSHGVVIVDEAHELQQRVTNVATSELSISTLRNVARQVSSTLRKARGDQPALSAEEDTEATVSKSTSDAGIDNAITGWSEAIDEARILDGAALVGRIPQIPDNLEPPLENLKNALWSAAQEIASIDNTAESSSDSLRSVLEQATTDPEAVARAKLRATITEIHDTIVTLLAVTKDSNHVAWTTIPWEPANGKEPDPAESKTINIAPRDISVLLRDGLFANSTVILTSATLALGGHFKKMLRDWGLPQDTRTLDLGLPFDTKKHGILYVATDLSDPRPNASLRAESSDRYEELIRAAGGRTLALFSSHRAAKSMAAEMRKRLPHPILLQGESGLNALIKEFADHERACLFGSLSLWQGVDVPGPSLSLVIIDKIPFPRPDDPMVQARQEAAGRDGFMEVSVNHAALLMAQGAGRLLRAHDDKGVVAVLDPRLGKKSYGRYIINSMPPMWETGNKAQVVRSLRHLTGSRD